jgi:hypothetical protein
MASVRVFKRLGTACLVAMMVTAFVTVSAFAQAPTVTAAGEEGTSGHAAGPAPGGTGTAAGAGPAGGGGAGGLSTPAMVGLVIVLLGGLVAIGGAGGGGGGGGGPTTTAQH